VTPPLTFKPAYSLQIRRFQQFNGRKEDDNGTVGILEAQNWGGSNPKEVITNADEANKRYNGDGGSTIGYGILPKP
jgi:hypothetical protein